MGYSTMGYEYGGKMHASIELAYKYLMNQVK